MTDRGAWHVLLGVAALSTALSASCRPAEGGDKNGPGLVAEWSTRDTVKVSGAATAEWCDSLRLLQIQSIHGDTGIAVALYPIGRFGPGRFPVVAPLRADSARPAAAVVMRWFAETAIRGFQGDSGEVMVEQPRAGLYSGTFRAWAHSVTDTAHLAVRGSFRDLTVGSAVRGCTARHPSPGPGAGVH